MPTIIDNGREREVTQDEYRRYLGQVATEERALLLTQNSGPTSRIRLYDRVDGTWTAPMDRNFAFQDHLKKVVWKCTACTYTSVYDGQEEVHRTQVMQRARNHENARLDDERSPHGDPTIRCSGCGAVFRQARRHLAEAHIEEAVRMALVHKNAGQVLIHRFGLEDSAVEVLARTNGHESTPDPVVNQGERRRSRRKRSRRSRQKVGV
jgi:hypothetical protein